MFRLISKNGAYQICLDIKDEEKGKRNINKKIKMFYKKKYFDEK